MPIIIHGVSACDTAQTNQNSNFSFSEVSRRARLRESVYLREYVHTEFGWKVKRVMENSVRTKTRTLKKVSIVMYNSYFEFLNKSPS